ncbi:tRNA pseudouridine(55) synthase TruB [Haloplasma contractile]|uniref:tRNA pseudouridine synthase B n=1 Tax=Haloplasma contractile SSD-17B TaxID=1033810 RepID=U2FRU4_9MOLU|nr:tRNA pseudouridine(55) synthase TruB [Haloplasma contractile]ERJ13684.1 tRNA pseudouridine synthase B protein [Haloplasma contractile SSD-17B]
MDRNGILLLNKPKKMTSHDCVSKMRRILGIKKIGHTGTLDPNVTGVLPLCIGEATKILQFLQADRKEYIAEIYLGKKTTTEDLDGDTIEEDHSDKSFTRTEILDVLSQFSGEIKQVPPMYSAVKVNGKKLYEYARKGIEVERPMRKVTIHEIELLSTEEEFSGTQIKFKIRALCSKGTYIRTLAVDIGKALSVPACMSELTRTRSGNFTIDQCQSFEEIETNLANLELISITNALDSFKKIEADTILEKRIKNGGLLSKADFNYDRILFVNKEQVSLAIYEPHPRKEHYIKPIRVFNISKR